MKRSRVIALAVVAGLGCSLWAAATAQDFSRNRAAPANSRVMYPAATTTARATTQSGGGDFSGKLVALSVRGGSQPKLLEKVRFQDVSGRRFLVGQEAQATFSLPLGAPAYVAWDAVDTFYVFDNVAQYEQAMKQALEHAQGAVGQVLGGFFPGAKGTIDGGPGFIGEINIDGTFAAPPPAAPGFIDPNQNAPTYAPVLEPTPAPVQGRAPKRILSQPDLRPR